MIDTFHRLRSIGVIMLGLLWATTGSFAARGGYDAAGGKFFAAKTPVPHKSSLDYVGDTHVYRVKRPDGTFKIGESAREQQQDREIIEKLLPQSPPKRQTALLPAAKTFPKVTP